MAVRFMHVRRIIWNEELKDYEIAPRGGVTIAYTIDEIQKVVMCTFVKCRNEPSTDDYLLAKREDALRSAMKIYREDADVSTFFKKMRKIETMRTTAQELFCYSTGRERSRQKLQAPDGAFDIIDLEHPVSEQLADWLATVVWPSGPESLGYSGNDMGYAIDVFKDDRGHWVSEFEPSMDTDPVAFDLDTPLEGPYIPDSQDFLHT